MRLHCSNHSLVKDVELHGHPGGIGERLQVGDGNIPHSRYEPNILQYYHSRYEPNILQYSTLSPPCRMFRLAIEEDATNGVQETGRVGQELQEYGRIWKAAARLAKAAKTAVSSCSLPITAHFLASPARCCMPCNAVSGRTGCSHAH